MDLFELSPEGTALPLRIGEPDVLDVSFFVPCYNEERHVVEVIDKLVTVATTLKLAYEILVFDDCSTDRTVEVVNAYRRAHPETRLRLFANEVNRGVARNFVEGAFQGVGAYYRMVCGDDVEPIETLQKVLENMGKADIIVPYHTQVIGRPRFRHLISRFYTVLVNIVSGRRLHYYNGLPLFRRRDATRFHVEATGLGFQAEFMLRLLREGRSYIEIPVVASDREGSVSLDFRNFVSVGYSIFRIAIRRVENLVRK